MTETLEKKAITQRIINILESDQFKDRVRREVTETSLFVKELGLDSLDRCELCYAVEEEIGISIPERDVWDLKNVSDYANYISQRYK